MDTFLDIHDLPKPTQEDINHLNLFVTIRLNCNKQFPNKEIPGPDGFTAEFYQTLEETTAMLLKLLYKMEKGMILLYYMKSILPGHSSLIKT
jgi:hypothetical protein